MDGDGAREKKASQINRLMRVGISPHGKGSQVDEPENPSEKNLRPSGRQNVGHRSERRPNKIRSNKKARWPSQRALM
jgi:hypothetical protein